jgi:hypothetical protein
MFPSSHAVTKAIFPNKILAYLCRNLSTQAHEKQVHSQMAKMAKRTIFLVKTQ